MILTHLILTRYALRIADKPPKPAKWYSHRRRVFETYCLPSIVNQSCRDFVWLLFNDEAAPVRADVERWQRECPQLVPVWTTEPWDNFNGVMRAAIRANLKPGTAHVITTRLDNDDAIARDFVEIVQAQCEGLPERRFVNFDLGQNLDTQSGRRIPHPHPCNMFVSCIEPVAQMEGVLTWAHNSIESIAHVIRPPFPNRWTHVVHPYNEWQPGRDDAA